MANWLRTLDLTPDFEKAQNEAIRPSEMAKIVRVRLLALTPIPDSGLDELRKELATQFDDVEDDTEDFDEAMDALYDWGDTAIDGGTNCCWIKTS